MMMMMMSHEARARCCGNSRQTGAVVRVCRGTMAIASRWFDSGGAMVTRCNHGTRVTHTAGAWCTWDFTCPDLAISHLHRASMLPLPVAVDAEDRKRTIYSTYCFVPLAIEIGTLWEKRQRHFFRDIGRRIAAATGEPRSTQFLFQRLSIAIQPAVGTPPVS